MSRVHYLGILNTWIRVDVNTYFNKNGKLCGLDYDRGDSDRGGF